MGFSTELSLLYQGKILLKNSQKNKKDICKSYRFQVQ